jgi:hypothetical protein
MFFFMTSLSFIILLSLIIPIALFAYLYYEFHMADIKMNAEKKMHVPLIKEQQQLPKHTQQNPYLEELKSIKQNLI